MQRTGARSDLLHSSPQELIRANAHPLQSLQGSRAWNDDSTTCPLRVSSPGQFVRVSMTRMMPLTIPYPWADDEVTVDGQAVVRVR
jgi:hypothetical protein